MKMMLGAASVSNRPIRIVRQTERAECGLACLAMIAAHHHLDIDLSVLRRQFKPSARGASLRSLIAVADQLGLRSRAVKVPLDKLGKLELPAILHWNMNHFVVIEKVKRGRALIHDPDGETRWLPLEEISHQFTGVALEVAPAAEFTPATIRERLRFSQLWTSIVGWKRALLQTIALSATLQLFALASPYFMQIAIDGVVPANDLELLAALAIGFGLMTILNGGVTLLRSYVLIAAGNSLGYGITANVARRLFRLPIEWFERRTLGDVLSRFQSVLPLKQFMTEGAVATILDGAMALLTFALMMFYSPMLAMVSMISPTLYGVLRFSTFGAQRRAQNDLIVAGGKEQTTMIESLRGITTLRLFNREAMRHALWQTRLAELTNSQISLSRVTAWQQAGNATVLGLETVLLVWLAIRQVVGGAFTVGMVFAFLAYRTQFQQRAISLIDQAGNFGLLKLHLERLSDIALSDQDRSFATIPTDPALLVGRIELRNVSFAYSPTDPKVLDDLSLSVEPGGFVAITGPSGGGKTTLVKILLGLIDLDSGDLLVDGVPLRQFGHKNYHEQVAAVLQDDHLFEGSIADNIALFDDQPDLDRIRDVARMAALHDDIQAMPMRYETLIGDMGSSLSGGQRQRLLLARALYRRPRLLILDEGTSHLDPAKEQAVNRAISELGITRIIVAHRIETIQSAERVVALAEGRLTDMTAKIKTAPNTTQKA